MNGTGLQYIQVKPAIEMCLNPFSGVLEKQNYKLLSKPFPENYDKWQLGV